MSNKHTPGEWKAIDIEIDSILCPSVVMINTSAKKWLNSLPRVIINNSHDQNTKSLIANAKLIAAAPDMLEALQEIIAISDRKHDAWDKGKAAIKKATT